MIDPINTVREKLILAETFEPLLLSNPPRKTPAALLYREALDTLDSAKNRINELLEANTQYVLRARTSEGFLIKILEHYVSLVSSGDAGYLNFEEEELIFEIRTYLNNGPWNPPTSES